MGDDESNDDKWEVRPDAGRLHAACRYRITIGMLINNNIREDGKTDRWNAYLTHSAPEM